MNAMSFGFTYARPIRGTCVTCHMATIIAPSLFHTPDQPKSAQPPRQVVVQCYCSTLTSLTSTETQCTPAQQALHREKQPPGGPCDEVRPYPPARQGSAFSISTAQAPGRPHGAGRGGALLVVGQRLQPLIQQPPLAPYLAGLHGAVLHLRWAQGGVGTQAARPRSPSA